MTGHSQDPGMADRLDIEILGRTCGGKIRCQSCRWRIDCPRRLPNLGTQRLCVYHLRGVCAPSNPTITAKGSIKYYGIGELLIAYGIKCSIDNGCRRDVVFDAKTDELAHHYETDFHVRRVASLVSGGPKRYMLADEGAWALFSKFLKEAEV